MRHLAFGFDGTLENLTPSGEPGFDDSIPGTGIILFLTMGRREGGGGGAAPRFAV